MHASTAETFLDFSQLELAAVKAAVPGDPIGKTAVLLEVLRSLDYLTICEPLVPESRKVGIHDLQLIHWGWNTAAELLLTPVSQPGAMPVLRGSECSASFAATLLHQAGRACLLKRTSDMIRYGLLTVDQSTEGFVVRQTEGLEKQFSDHFESARLDDLKRFLDDTERESAHGWRLVNYDDASTIMNEPGAFMARRRESPLAKWKRDDVNSLMASLIFPWDSGSGIMMGYGAHPDVDTHFMVEGLNLIDACRHEAGLHPTSRMGDTCGSDVTAVAAIIAGLHLKHIRFALLSQKTHPEILFKKSLTIWGPRSELVESISEFSGLEAPRVDKALSAITVGASEAGMFTNRTAPLIPMLIDLENGHVLRPVSSICRNPLFSVLPIQQFRGASNTHEILGPREDWLRSEIYSMFQGARYATVEGNIKLKDGSRVVTDVDAAILDRTSGDLALFQLKWQDFATNDVRELRSKASNFVKEVDKWANRVVEWIISRSVQDVLKTFRFSAARDGHVRRVFMFVVSRHACRMAGYGFTSTNAFLALATWPQWVRVRTYIGPAPNVFDRIHERLCEEYEREAEVSPLPYTMKVTCAGKVIEYENLFVGADDSQHPADG